MNKWQIKNMSGLVLVDNVTHAIALEMLAILQLHNIPVTMHHVGGAA
ncbi:hypothetical protein [Caballeronia sordidicola]|uniref:Uncharacterized protein n=1 Tax=Caballeronia sordidicola TaxID=196367 RepID=A0A242M842_CABSO|nr:hypothetical protein [Caballeronia sordidicola]OTP67333.1 hypothetical protein PAMC26510_31690 [Caballeronia sordidicola]